MRIVKIRVSCVCVCAQPGEDVLARLGGAGEAGVWMEGASSVAGVCFFLFSLSFLFSKPPFGV